METIREFKLTEKKQILVRFIETLVFTGYDIKPFINKPFSFYDYNELIKQTIEQRKEHELELEEREIEFLNNQEPTTEDEPTTELTLDERHEIGKKKYGFRGGESELKAISTIQTDNREETQQKFERSRKYDYTEFCHCCGRGIKGEPKFGIWTIEGPMAVPANTTEEQMADVGLATQGAFPIGSECAKRYPKGYITNW